MSDGQITNGQRAAHALDKRQRPRPVGRRGWNTKCTRGVLSFSMTSARPSPAPTRPG